MFLPKALLIIFLKIFLTYVSAMDKPNIYIVINSEDYPGIKLTYNPFIKALQLYMNNAFRILEKGSNASHTFPRVIYFPYKKYYEDRWSDKKKTSSTSKDLSTSTTSRTIQNENTFIAADAYDKGTCMTNGGKYSNTKCVFPFIYKGIEYYSCTWYISIYTKNQPWCSTKVDVNNNHIKGNWGTCDPNKCPKHYPPRECGVPAKKRRQKRIIRDNELDIKEIPWMTSLGIFEKRKWMHKCGGSLISHKFILTSAHCLDTSYAKSYRVRLGNADLNIHNWVRQAYMENDKSGENEITSAIKRTYLHPRFVMHRPYFDIGLAETERYIEFTDYVRPICLPFHPSNDEAHVNDLVIIAGWGENENGTVTNELRQTRLQVYSKKFCENLFPKGRSDNFDINNAGGSRILLTEGISHDLICIGSEIQHTGACHGDSGSASIRKVIDTMREPYFEQLFIVTTGTTCDTTATIYSKINHPETLPWIRRIAEMEHHLVVIGGFSPNRTNKLLRDVEFISSKPNNICQNKIDFLNGKLTRNFYHSAAARGRAGIVARDALFVCGGTNSVEHLKTCHVYNPLLNKWFYTDSLKYERADASAVLSSEGDFWIIGGANGSISAESTEIFDINNSQWRRASPLPSELRNSGISYHCSVRLNRTHILIAGGYAAPYVFRNPFREVKEEYEDYEEEDGYSVPGISLKSAWMFDGFYWKRLSSMNGNRDRLACSTLNDNGVVKVLVAGGCREWCETSPAIPDVEIYDPTTNKWSFAAPLPEPLHSAKMEEFLGKPTIVGGFNRTTQIERIYSYNVENNSWELLNKRLRIPRSSHALIKVPYEMFEHC
ncbi:uncharacterized protein [Lepeophtheirus salmonis]|uniref:uncharacterized protein isoform X1 n=1 Tax=Lepeophtheirus salmonis TaxID=72036 RepID=UPI001AE16917|nr:uncharacterized protein LOC121128752 isoform X3 [Lepeophtheirus salmonis]